MYIVPGVGRTRRGPLADAELVVVGGGVVGTCAAYRLSQAGAAVTLIDAESSDRASDYSFAWANAYAKYPRSYWQLNIDGIRGHLRLAAEVGAPWFHATGSIRWEDPANQSATDELAQNIRTFRSWGGLVEDLSAQEVMSTVEPALRIPPGVEAVYRIVGEGWVDTGLLRASVLARARMRFGLTYVNDVVTAVTPASGSSSASVGLRSGQVIPADLIVIAAGVASRDLAALADLPVPLGNEVSTMVVFENAAEDLHSIVRSTPLHIRPGASGELWVGSSAAPRRPDGIAAAAEVAQGILADLTQMIPGSSGCTVKQVGVGVQPVPADNYPIVGHEPNADGIYYLLTRSGVSVAPRLAELIVGDLTGHGESVLDDYQISRFRGARAGQIGPPGEN